MRLNSSIKISRALMSAAVKDGWISGSLESVPKETAEAVVIGAGVVGVAVARELAAKGGREVLVVESAPTFGTGSSSRNSEVIHAGIYYPPNSLKARLCVRGRHLLYDYCRAHGIPHKQIGKLIVATRPSEVPKLSELMSRGVENGVEGLRMMDGEEAMRVEPQLYCTKALLSPVSGIIDSHSLMLSLLGEAESHGAIFSYNTSVIGGRYEGGRLQLYVCESESLRNWDRASPLKPDLILSPRIVVNSAGLGALPLAKRIHGLDDGIVPTPYFARGCYFTLSNVRSPPFQHLIYPLPEDGGLGVHVTLDLNGQVKFGPDVEWIDGVDEVSNWLNLFDYSVGGDGANRFYPEIRKYYPDLRDGSLEAGYAGIRPKLCGKQQIPSDFVVQGEKLHGVRGLVNLFGIESPGLTASMAIAEHVVPQLSHHFN
ncbi:L-2-hydroxyglutarate dehydrogenase, mitochondrial [Salvia miltiorrhiza]|uniref:L-2-hydroxyglutarate dehydrogenase, mitochondrial n=1 Tax=Salvia miltiorrhiza TaxID=226208 RepID=UPI0025AD9C60|nr:L-2-hydroxyglutarate dehydrogenase, mitochondrial [Salvia miltiorrhiza]